MDEAGYLKKIKKVKDLGSSLRQVRHDLALDQVRAAGLSGVGVRFLSELERGKDSVSMDKVLAVVERLGLELWLAPKGYRPDKAGG